MAAKREARSSASGRTAGKAAPATDAVSLAAGSPTAGLDPVSERAEPAAHTEPTAVTESAARAALADGGGFAGYTKLAGSLTLPGRSQPAGHAVSTKPADHGAGADDSATIVQLPEPTPLASSEYAVPDIPQPPAHSDSSVSGAGVLTREEAAEIAAAVAAVPSPFEPVDAALVKSGPVEKAPAQKERAKGAEAEGPSARETASKSRAFPEPPKRIAGDTGRHAILQTEHDVLFGELARLERFASAEQVTDGLRIQQKLLKTKRKRKIGKIMVKLGYMTVTQAKYVLRLQRSKDPIDGYKLLERRGQGGMGVVYRAVQKSLKREVAVKILSPRIAQEKRFLQRFFQEAKLSAELNHPNVVSAIDFGESNGYYYYAMEYVDGWSVSEMLNEDGPFDEEEALDIVLQVAKGLEHAAEAHIVHRDIKPENIMVTPDGVAKLTDLGLSKQLTSDCSITVEGKTLGTPFYVSPELARGTKNVDTRSDIYSLGATLYHMLGGNPPFMGDNAAAIMACHIVEEPVPIRDVADHVSRNVGKLVEKMMQKSPKRRYQTASELCHDIILLLDGKNPYASPRPHADSGSGRMSASRAGTSKVAKPKRITGQRRAYNPDGRERGSGAGNRGNSAVIAGMAVAVLLIGLLIWAVNRSETRDRSGRGGTATADGMSAAERSRLARARIQADRPVIRDHLDRGELEAALAKAKALVAAARGTDSEGKAETVYESIRDEVIGAVKFALKEAERSLDEGKPGFALAQLDGLPTIDDPEIARSLKALRARASAEAGSE